MRERKEQEPLVNEDRLMMLSEFLTPRCTNQQTRNTLYYLKDKQETLAHLNKDSLEALGQVFPAEQQMGAKRIRRFFASPHTSEALRLLGESAQYGESFGLNELNSYFNRRGGNSMKTFLPVLKVALHPRIIEAWQSVNEEDGKEGETSSASPIYVAKSIIKKFKPEGEPDEWLQQITDNFSSFSWHELYLLFGRQESEIQYLLSHPETAHLILDTKIGHWHDDLLNAYAILDRFGIASVPKAITDSFIWEDYNRKLEAEHGTKFGSLWTLARKDPSLIFDPKTGEINEGDLNPYDQMWVDITARGRGALEQYKSRKLSTVTLSEWRDTQARLTKALPRYQNRQPVVEIDRVLREEDIDWKEDPRHPLAHLLNTIGFEAERQRLDPFTAQIRRDIQKYGFFFDKGQQPPDGGTEDSPYFCRHVDTLTHVVKVLYDHNLINPALNHGYSIHLNMGQKNKDLVQYEGIPFFTHLMQGTTWAYYPYIRNLRRDLTHFNFRVAPKGLDTSMRTESKEYSFMSTPGLIEFLNLSFYIYPTVEAYYKKMMVPEKNLSPDEIKMAGAYETWKGQLESIYRQMKLKEMGQMSIHFSNAQAFQDHICKVYGNPSPKEAIWEEYKGLNWPSESINERVVKPVTVERVSLPNFVAAHRYIAHIARQNVLGILESAELSFKKQLATVRSDYSPYVAIQPSAQALFQRFPCGLLPDEINARLKNTEAEQKKHDLLQFLFAKYEM